MSADLVIVREVTHRCRPAWLFRCTAYAAVYLVAAASISFGDDLLTGFRQHGLSYQGPGEWRHPVEPVWVYDYHTLRLRYKASGLPGSDTPILTLRPGSVGPVTPGATNPENPFVAGSPVVVIRARDLVADGTVQTLEVGLLGKMRTARIDQLRYSLPAGAKLQIEDLQFTGSPDLFPCGAGGPDIPANAKKLRTRGPLACSGSPATSMREKQSIHMEGGGARGGALYMSMMARFAGVSGFGLDHRPGSLRIHESSETADVLVRVEYTDGTVEEQFPMLVSDRRHALLNLKPALYVLALDSTRRVQSIELMDRSPHVQLALYAAGVSGDAVPASADEVTVPKRPSRKMPSGEVSLDGSKWYRITAPAEAVRADFRGTPAAGTRDFSLTVTNVSRQSQTFTVIFPALAVRPGEAAEDTYYVFPRQGAVISNADQTLEAAYSGTFPLQFVDIFAPSANRGACVIVKDTSGRGKKFRLRKTGARVEIEVEYTVSLAPGETFQPANAQLAQHDGDWRSGFAAYKGWLKSWYKPAGPRPAWLREAFWARRDYPVGGTGKLYNVQRDRYTFENLIEDGAAFGGIDFIDISGWAMSNTAGRVGDYPIELGGPEDLRRNIAAAWKAGIPTGLYFEGYLIDKNSKVGRESGAEWQIVDEQGRRRWWSGGSPELFACPYVPAWQHYLGERTAAVAKQVGASAVYLDEYGFGRQRCYAATHGHAPGIETLPGEIAMTRSVRLALDAAGMRETILYLEETPPDAVAPYYDAAFSYNFPFADRALSPLKLNLWRFAFPDIRLWDMVSIGVDPRELPAEDFRLSLWHGNGLWLKGHSDTWYGEDLLAFVRRSHALLKQHAGAFSGAAEPLTDSPHPSVFVNRFQGEHETVYTLFNASYRTANFRFEGRMRTLGPREVDVVGVPARRGP